LLGLSCRFFDCEESWLLRKRDIRKTGSSKQSNSSATLTPDVALIEITNYFNALRTARGSKESLMTGFTTMIAGLNPVAASLLAGMPGVPSNVAMEVAVAVGTFAATSQLVVVTWKTL
jgi:hypothetical protein